MGERTNDARQSFKKVDLGTDVSPVSSSHPLAGVNKTQLGGVTVRQPWRNGTSFPPPLFPIMPLTGPVSQARAEEAWGCPVTFPGAGQHRSRPASQLGARSLRRCCHPSPALPVLRWRGHCPPRCPELASVGTSPRAPGEPCRVRPPPALEAAKLGAEDSD